MKNMTAALSRQTLIIVIAIAATGAATLWALSSRAAAPAEPAAAAAPRPV